MPTDRSSPVYYLKIGNLGQASAQRLDASIRVISVKYDDEEAKQDKITLTIDNHDLANFDNPLFAVGNVVEFQYGYPGAMGRVRTATITKVTGSLQLKVECKGKAHVANLAPKARAFSKMTRAQIAAQIADEHGLANQSTIDYTTPTGDPLAVLDHVPQSRETDAQFLRQLAHKEGFDYYEDNTGFHFHARKLDAPSKRTFIYSFDPNQGDIETFNVDGDITAKPAVIIASGRDPLSKENFAPYAYNQNLQGRPTNAAAQLAPPIAITVGSNTGAKFSVPTAANAAGHSGVFAGKDKTDVTNQVKAAATRAEQKALKLTLNCVGDALIEAKQTITVRGLGRVLDGNYHITSATHTIGPGYKMKLVCARSGTGSLTGMSGNSDDSTGADNKTKGPAEAGQGVVVVSAPTGAGSFAKQFVKG